MAIFKSIKGFPGYKVGDNGYAWSHKSGVWRRLKFDVSKRGYSRVSLRSKENPKGRRLIHRLVLEAFVGPCPVGMEACHGDGNPRNNRLSNLRWDTKKANQADRIRHGTLFRPQGEKNKKNRLTADMILEIRRLYGTGKYRQQRLAARFAVNRSMISMIVNFRRWGHLHAEKDIRS